MTRIALTLALLALLALAAPASALDYEVNTTTDTTDFDCVPSAGGCSIRDALAEANATVGVADRILIPAGTYDLTAAGLGDDAGATGDLDVTDDVSIIGAGARTTIIRDQNGDRVLHFRNGASAMSASGLTIRDGGGAAPPNAPSQGGGISHNAIAGLTLNDVAILANTAASDGASAQGGGLFIGGPATLDRVTVSGNTADGALATFGGQGGGIFVLSTPATLRNLTVSGNATTGNGSQGGGIFFNDATDLFNATITGNQANPGGGAQGGGLFVNDPNVRIANSVVAGNLDGNAGEDCGLNSPFVSLGGNVAGDGTCGFVATGDLQSANPLLGALADNGGHVDTHALGDGSPALDRATNCQGTAADARGVARPQGSACDSGAFEREVAAVTPPPVETPPSEPAAPPTTTTVAGPALLPPVLGRLINAEPVSGTVRVRVAGSRRFVPLAQARQIPVGSIIDARKGRVRITVAGRTAGTFHTADFYAGMFRITQLSSAMTELQLVGGSFARCPRGARASARRRLKQTSVVRQLWGDGSGKFRTKGRFSTATLRGTRWLTADRCDGTLTRVAAGRVLVRDLARRRNILLRAGQRYVARPRRAR